MRCFIKQLKQAKRNTQGFTLLEMLIALSIFVLIVVVIVNVYVIINASQRKTVAQQRLQSDSRYLFEAIAQQVRLGRINYDFYVDQNISLHPDATEDACILAVLDQSNLPVYFRQSTSTLGVECQGSQVQYCEEQEDGDCNLIDGEGWQNITPNTIQVDNLRFEITPSADPYFAGSEVSCTADQDCLDEGLESYRCDDVTDNRCEYYSDNGNFQPKTRIIFRSIGLDDRIPEGGRIVEMQSTVSSRILPGPVTNEYHDQ